LVRARTEATPSVAWRLPNVKELSSIADKRLSHPAIDGTAFPATPSSTYSWFWSSSPFAGDPAFAWGVDFSDGYYDYRFNRTHTYYVRLVRAGQ
jgi:hypothetical protein